jgi:hypothetical protein
MKPGGKERISCGRRPPEKLRQCAATARSQSSSSAMVAAARSQISQRRRSSGHNRFPAVQHEALDTGLRAQGLPLSHRNEPDKGRRVSSFCDLAYRMIGD